MKSSSLFPAASEEALELQDYPPHHGLHLPLRQYVCTVSSDSYWIYERILEQYVQHTFINTYFANTFIYSFVIVVKSSLV